MEHQTLDVLTRCNAESSRLALDTPYCRTCHKLHGRLRSPELNVANEIFAAPTWQPLAPFRSLP